jgi:hypothetical protein
VASMNARAVHRDVALYMAHPDEFRPERWLPNGAVEMKLHMYQVCGNFPHSQDRVDSLFTVWRRGISFALVAISRNSR